MKRKHGSAPREIYIISVKTKKNDKRQLYLFLQMEIYITTTYLGTYDKHTKREEGERRIELEFR